VVARRPSVPDLQAPRVTIPNQTTDPIWSLKPWPVTLTIDGKDLEFPAATAADWLHVLMASPVDLDDVIAAMATEGEHILLDESIGAELYDACLDVISAVSGRPWWQAMRLISVVKANWNTLGGEMLYRGVLPDRMSLSAWLDVLLLVTIRSMDPKDVTMFTLKLEQQPAEVIDVEPQELEMSRSQFLSMA
jgi:hypothetical protein